MTIEPIDVRDLIGPPGHLAARRTSTGRSRGSAPSSPASATTSPSQGDLLLESLVEGILVSGTLAARSRCDAPAA